MTFILINKAVAKFNVEVKKTLQNRLCYLTLSTGSPSYACAKHWSAQALPAPLGVNHNKSKMMVCSRKKINQSDIVRVISQSVNTIPFVSKINILGINIDSRLDMSSHIDHVISKCNQSFYALRVLKVHGCSDVTLRDVFYALIMSRITYGHSAWSGFCKSKHLGQLQKLIKRGYRCGFGADLAQVRVEEVFKREDNCLFKKILSNPNHVLHTLLPEEKQTGYCLRRRGHNRRLPEISVSHNLDNFVVRMLYETL